MSDEWLKILLQKMDRDLAEIKKDVKRLQAAKFKLQGGYIALNAVVAAGISLATFYFKK